MDVTTGMRRHRSLVSVLLLATAFLAVGCTASQVLGVRDVPPMGTGYEEAIAVLLRQFPGKVSADFIAKEKEIGSCISDSIHTAVPNLQIIPPDAVRWAAFPGLTPEEIPLSPESLAVLLNDSGVQERMAQMNLRYLVVVEGNTTQEKPKLSLFDNGIARADGVAWARRAQLSAVLVDVRENRRREVTVSSTGRAWVGIVAAGGYNFGLALPIVIPAFPESRACSDLGEAVAQWLVEAQTMQP